MDGAIAARTQTTAPAALAEPYGVVLLAAGSVGGALPDRSGRRKPFVIRSAAAPTPLPQMLPAAIDQGKGVGLINIADSLPLVVAPLAAGVVLGLMNSYPAPFALSGPVTVMAGWTVSRVRSML
jgi:hypothetical protein